MGACLLTAFVLYYGPVSLAVGHRHAVELVHVWAGYALPVPMLLGLASAAYRSDLGRLNRFSTEDWRWLRSQEPPRRHLRRRQVQRRAEAQRQPHRRLRSSCCSAPAR